MIKQLLLIGAILAPVAMSATDFFVTPEGNGDKDGSTWENAMGLTEFYAKKKFVEVSESTTDHLDDVFYFATGNYTFTQTVFFYRQPTILKGGYDPSTGELATTGRTVFNGNNQSRTNGALQIVADAPMGDANAEIRKVSISNIDFENFVSTGIWRDGGNNWQTGYPSTIYMVKVGEGEFINCNFRNNKCTGTGSFNDESIGNAQDRDMAGAVSMNQSNILFTECSFVGNSGTQGGAVKVLNAAKWATGEQDKLHATFDRCYFADNTTETNGAAIYARHATKINVINSTFANNTANANGGGIYMNGPGYYSNILNLVSSTVAGNTAAAGAQIYSNGKGALNIANSIIVGDGGDGGVDAIADASATSEYKFQGNNFVGNVAEGYTATDTDNISADNTFEAIFGDNTLAANGTITPEKFVTGMAPAAIASIVAAESWSYTVDSAVDQLGTARTANTSNGALAITNTTTGIESVADNAANDADGAWYTLQGMRLSERPAAKGIYIHNGRKVLVR